MTSLRRGWAEASLSELLATGLFVDGDWIETKDQDPAGDVRLIQLADIGVGHFRNRSARFLTSNTAERLHCTILEPGDVLVARMPDPLGRSCQLPSIGITAITAVDVCIIRPDSRSVDPKWIMWMLNAPQVRKQVAELQSGTTRKRISRRNLGTVRLLVPPRREQARVVDAIDRYFSRLDFAQQLLRQAKCRLGNLRASVLSHAIDQEWPIVQLQELLLDLRNGVFVSRPSSQPPGHPIFRISAVRPLALRIDDVRFARLDEKKASAYLVDEGDLLFTRYSGNPDYVGACAQVRRLPQPTLHPDKLIRAVVDRTRALPGFLEIALNTGMSRRAIAQRRKTTAGQVGIAGGQLKTVPIPIPSLTAQARVCEEVERQLSIIEAMDGAIDAALQRSEALRQSVLRRAFAGELVPQDPADEPASELLSRLQAESSQADRRARKQRGANVGEVQQ